MTSQSANPELVAPAQAQAAQIPLQSFTLPTFPLEAFTAGLTSLILTSDIPINDYGTLIQEPFTIPDLPPSITSLTLEGFALGYFNPVVRGNEERRHNINSPSNFLSTLCSRLSPLASLTLYEQVFPGSTTPTIYDGTAFLVRLGPSLKSLHLIDVFAPAGFWDNLSPALAANLKVLEWSYTTRSDEGWLESLGAEGIAGFVAALGKEVVGITVRIVKGNDGEGEEGGGRVVDDEERGIKVVEGEPARALARGLVGEIKDELLLLDVSMFALKAEEVSDVLDKCPKVKSLSIAVELKSWEEALGRLAEKERGVEEIDIIGVLPEGADPGLVTKGQLEKIADGWKALKNLKISTSKTAVVEWVKDAGEWTRRA
ncbi:hypothetical protein B0O99DRAFT_596279 [Bisporella sp. PMI_857]|nr:hypothetical protein B0O99DRAFT_596279 [Bisporella sp. PMI_857]